MTKDQIKHMVNRFLAWRLPENFNPDGGVSFTRTFNDWMPTPQKYEPIGTNLFDFTQAEAMVRHMVEGMPSPQQTAGAVTREELAETLKPFALVAAVDIGRDEADDDQFRNATRDYAKAPPIAVGDIRRAADILARLGTAEPITREELEDLIRHHIGGQFPNQVWTLTPLSDAILARLGGDSSMTRAVLSRVEARPHG